MSRFGERISLWFNVNMPPTDQSQQNYDFIVNPTPTPKRNPFAEASLAKRVAVIGGGLIVLFILFSIVKGIVSGPSEAEQYLSIVQNQQQLIAISSAASKESGLSTKSINSALTAQSSLATDQSATLTYMATNGKKVKPKDLVAKNSASLNAQLAASVEAGTYDQTYQSVMTQQLQTYMQDMQKVYKQTNGKKGHALLDTNYRNANLLLKQLENE